jgi:hypothetical protein
MATNRVTGDCATFSGEVLIKNIAGTTTLSGTVGLQSAEGGMGTTDLDLTADDTTDALVVTVTGNGGTDIRWNIVLDYMKINFV